MVASLNIALYNVLGAEGGADLYGMPRHAARARYGISLFSRSLLFHFASMPRLLCHGEQAQRRGRTIPRTLPLISTSSSLWLCWHPCCPCFSHVRALLIPPLLSALSILQVKLINRSFCPPPLFIATVAFVHHSSPYCSCVKQRGGRGQQGTQSLAAALPSVHLFLSSLHLAWGHAGDGALPQSSMLVAFGPQM